MKLAVEIELWVLTGISMPKPTKRKRVKKVVVPRTYYNGEVCFKCEQLIKYGKTQNQIDIEHENCHGWYHCGNECCGECSYCGQ